MITSITLSKELQERIENLLVGTESISQFVYRAATEKVKRLEARDERAQLQTAIKTKDALRPHFKGLAEELGMITIRNA